MRKTLKGALYVLIPLSTLVAVYEGGRVHQQYNDQAAVRQQLRSANIFNSGTPAIEELLNAAKRMADKNPTIYRLADTVDNIATEHFSDYRLKQVSGIAPKEAYKNVLPYDVIINQLNQIEKDKRFDFIMDRLRPVIEALSSTDKKVRVMGEGGLDEIIIQYGTSHPLEMGDAVKVLTQRYEKRKAEGIKSFFNMKYNQHKGKLPM